MQYRSGLFVSLLLNGLLTTLLILHWREVEPIIIRRPIVQKNITIKTNLVQQTSRADVSTLSVPEFTWKDIQGGSLENYVANLRLLHCPEPVIHKVIIHEVNELYSRKIATEIVGGDNQWWKSTPDPDLVEQGLGRLESMETESNALLTRLLGPGWEKDVEEPSEANHAGVSLTGPLLGELPDDTKKKVYDLVEQKTEEARALTQAAQAQGIATDPEKLAALKLQTREELAKVLSPEQLEEYLLRYSDTAQNLRAEFHDIDLTPDQFRAVFRLRDPLQQQLQQYAANDPTSAAVRQNIIAQEEQGIQQALGPQLYAAYKTSQDPQFQQARQTVEAAGAEPETIVPIYQINQVAQTTINRINRNSSISADDRMEAIRAVRQQQTQAIQQLLQPQQPPPLPEVNTK